MPSWGFIPQSAWGQSKLSLSPSHWRPLRQGTGALRGTWANSKAYSADCPSGPDGVQRLSWRDVHERPHCFSVLDSLKTSTDWRLTWAKMWLRVLKEIFSLVHFLQTLIKPSDFSAYPPHLKQDDGFWICTVSWTNRRWCILRWKLVCVMEPPLMWI